MLSQRGGIFLILLILTAFAIGIFGIYKLSQVALPGQILYPVKLELENLRLVTTELSKVERALVYIDFANKRLDELEALEEKGEKVENLLPVINKFWENEEMALKLIKRETISIKDPQVVYKAFKQLRLRQEIILNRLLEKIPAPEFYEVLDIKNKAMEALNDPNFR